MKKIIQYICLIAAVIAIYNFLFTEDDKSSVARDESAYVVGTWHTSYEYDGMIMEIDVNFQPDNVLLQTGTMKMPDPINIECEFSSKGTYSINEKYLRLENKGKNINCNDRDFGKAFETVYSNLHSISTSEILSIDRKQKKMVIEYEDIGKITYQKQAP